MADDKKPLIQVKRIKKVAGGHHGGAWKIAYADFVTAMMAFFLLMWLLGSTAKGDLQGISDYFKTPLKVALSGGSGTGDSSSIIKGGGDNLTRSAGQMKMGDRESRNRVIDIKASEADRIRLEKAYLQSLKQRIETLIDQRPNLNAFRRQLLLDITSEGLRIQIVDEQNRPMFDSGNASLKDHTRAILRELAPVLNSVSNPIGLSGHTDAAPYLNGSLGYGNWELSADRANAARRELVAGGLEESKLLRVVGLGSAVMLDPDQPTSPMNRRISIIVMNRDAETRLRSDGKLLNISDVEPASAAAVQQAAP